jgi:stage IV sporulation protein FB
VRRTRGLQAWIRRQFDPGRGFFVPVLGFPLRVRATFFVIAAVVAATAWPSPLRMLLRAVILFLSILIHELGHALLASRAGGVVSLITLHALGGETRWLPLWRPDWRKTLLVGLGGPFASLTAATAGIVALRLPWRTVVWSDFWTELFWVNAVLALVNLLPILPLDGGQVARLLLVRLFPTRGELYCAFLGVLVGVGAFLVAVGQGLAWGALIFAWMALRNFDAARQLFPARRIQWSRLTPPDPRDRYG